MLLILITVLNFVIANSLKVTMFNSDLIKKSNNEEKELIIIRHGRTEMNEQLSIQEWGSDNFVDKRLFDTKLTVTGVRQAQKVNQEIISKSLGEIDLLISSPLSRTLQTAELVFKGTHFLQMHICICIYFAFIHIVYICLCGMYIYILISVVHSYIGIHT
jgi:hypothetical protein